MLATDFIKTFINDFEIIWYDKKNLDITNIENIEKKILNTKPDLVFNCAAYTNVDDAEDIWKNLNFDINTIWVYNLSKITSKYNIDFITISTDYVFDWKKHSWYYEYDKCNPINQYGMSKYLWEKLSLLENKNTIIIRTSWLYGWWKEFKNFVNNMLRLSKINDELKIVNDQFWFPTYCNDLNFFIKNIIENISKYRWKILHYSNFWKEPITWFIFAKEIFKISWINVKIIPCSSDEFKTKSRRPKNSLLKNNNDFVLQDWKKSLKKYLNIINL